MTGISPTYTTHERTVAHKTGVVRLDRFLQSQLEAAQLSREKLKSLIKDGLVSVNGVVAKRASQKLQGGEHVEIRVPHAQSGLVAENKPITILYKDKDLLVLNKPAGLTVHPAAGVDQGTLAHRLVHHFPQLATMDSERPGIVHRLDKDTSGLMLVALNERARILLSAAFAAHEVAKHYVCVVLGVPDSPKGTIDAPMGRHPTYKTKMAVVAKGGRQAKSSYRVLYADPKKRFSLVAVRIFTGRTHQIRVHMSHIGYGLYGDSVYKAALTEEIKQIRSILPPLYKKLAKRQLLHAWKLSFHHPKAEEPTKEDLSFTLPPPQDFMRTMLYVSRTPQRVVLTGTPGCGKSTVLNQLRNMGLPTFSADEVVSGLYEPGQDGWQFIKNRFGEKFLSADSNNQDLAAVDRARLFQAMRENDYVRQEVVDFIHPMVRYALEDFWREHRHERVAFAEIPLFIEAENSWRENMTDILVGVHSPQQVRQQRLLEKRGWPEDMFATMESWQWGEKEKMQACDLVVDNAGTPEELIQRTHGLCSALTWLRRQKARRLHEHFKKLLLVPLRK